MAQADFIELRKHIGHMLECSIVEDDVTGIEDGAHVHCVDCGIDLLICDRKDVDDDCGDKAVWQLNIMTKYGTDTFTFENESLALQQLYLYVKQRWDDEVDAPLPSDELTAISDYFTDNDREAYIIAEVDVLCDIEEY